MAEDKTQTCLSQFTAIMPSNYNWVGTLAVAASIMAEDWLLWRCSVMLAISLRAATSAVPFATRKNTSSRVVTLKP